MHDFLVDKSDKTLTKKLEDILKLREYIRDLPETVTTFRVSNVDGVTAKNMKEIHLEFLKTWSMHRVYNQSTRRYVNPNSIHANQYSDLVVECECGVRVVNSYTGGPQQITPQDEHKEHCLPHYRQRARADLFEMRYNEIRRLASIGWYGKDIANRLGTSQTAISQWASQYNLRFGQLRNVFRKHAGETYAYLVRMGGVEADLVGEMYELSPTTLRSYYNKFGDIEIDNYEFRKDDKGRFGWQRSSTQKPDFLTVGTDD